ncbi:glutamine-hydrolyzing carbamoyl-phosphate synthase small subunit [Fodinicurvata sp. EGI_FJ10296]|uniref:glutamine-hydrolyzing carbamoyl-phosphate synthase small subunit n=1 Tax=Fodinicurvata sp. EGI_FJ10296 TaxID=3231908 RepID=UPI003455F20F
MMQSTPFSSTASAPAPSSGSRSGVREATGALVLADGTVFRGRGIGAHGRAVGEVCFNTGMTGYQETLTDPSYAGQIVTFTFPHIGNVGANVEDVETTTPAARGLIVRHDPTAPSNWRSERSLDDWLKMNGIVGLSGIDTRRLTRRIRDGGPPVGVIVNAPDGNLDIDAALDEARAWPGLEGMDLARDVTCTQTYSWRETCWSLNDGYGVQDNPTRHVVAIDYGAKRNILRCLATAGCRVTVVPATATAEDILSHRPDGIFLSNGPGDPSATGAYAVPTLRSILQTDVPVMGICLGHQLLSLALGGQTRKLERGHRGANHPVKDLATGKVEITSQNHGFAVVPESLPEGIVPSHVSLFDGTNEGIRLQDRPVFSVQYHPEASPGPVDSHYLFDRFMEMIDRRA